MVKTICKSAGISNKTNHSLRATSATEMFQAGVPEKGIQKISGHRSVAGLRLYGRISGEQKVATAVLSSSDKVDYNSLLPPVKLDPPPSLCGSDWPSSSTASVPGNNFHFHGCTVALNFSVKSQEDTQKS